jgi:hypothetical protein
VNNCSGQDIHIDRSPTNGLVGSIYVGLVDTSDDTSHIHINTKSSLCDWPKWKKYVQNERRRNKAKKITIDSDSVSDGP